MYLSIWDFFLNVKQLRSALSEVYFECCHPSRSCPAHPGTVALTPSHGLGGIPGSGIWDSQPAPACASSCHFTCWIKASPSNPTDEPLPNVICLGI